jgi:hypothetical protein
VKKAVQVASDSDLIILAVGANWNSDGESGDRATLELSPNQSLYQFFIFQVWNWDWANNSIVLLAELADAMFGLGKPIVLVLQGGRPFAIPEYYNKSAAVLNTVSYSMSSNYTSG